MSVPRYGHIVVLSGAGLSAESGLSTFRDNGGLWDSHRVEDVATPEAYARNPDLVQRFYNERRAKLADVQPNAAHRALGRLQQAFDGQVTLVTQNVDDLLERGGARDVIHMHGELLKVRCVPCGTVHGWRDDCTQATRCPACGAAPGMRPDIVWFGEMPYHLDRIYAALGDCDLFVSIGTSGNVYPAAGFVAEVRRAGYAHTVEINLEPSAGVSYFAERRHGKAGEIVPDFVESLLKGEAP
ncbi:Sir2 family NAD+-dependent deacetylase [Gimibacter soli]|uniref:NAD-dependent protein deacylase n=1 Tax=Gimibacter soli TaxID=3024400 RepID=A0AAE9XWV5_9PROT|nr:Sir2 family NAD+-dependent deacetylase [Gimibacter soli]WCL54909.1 NAD-dependent protein deacylase [Gimibacter soli]